MSEQVKLENKYVEVDGNGYRLTIDKKRNIYKTEYNYTAYLSSTESPFTANSVFRTSTELQTDLKTWIIKMDELNHSEDVVFDRLHDWDGVIEI